MFSLLDLRFESGSRDLDVLRPQRIIGLFILITQILPTNQRGQLTHVIVSLDFTNKLNSCQSWWNKITFRWRNKSIIFSSSTSVGFGLTAMEMMGELSSPFTTFLLSTYKKVSFHNYRLCHFLALSLFMRSSVPLFLSVFFCIWFYLFLNFTLLSPAASRSLSRSSHASNFWPFPCTTTALAPPITTHEYPVLFHFAPPFPFCSTYTPSTLHNSHTHNI